jgi:hypothetical protein
MNRAALEHILRAASAASGEREFIVIGSQAILGQFPAAPAALLTSIEADIYPRHAPERSDVVDGALGELSECHQSFGYYAHGVDDTTAILPAGWAARLVRLENANTGGAIGWCLEAHDLALSKLVASRERHVRFLRVLLQEGMVDSGVLGQRLETLPLPAVVVDGLRARLNQLISEARQPPA